MDGDKQRSVRVLVPERLRLAWEMGDPALRRDDDPAEVLQAMRACEAVCAMPGRERHRLGKRDPPDPSAWR